ncbi:MAG: Uma2 family endonuclease [Fimbriimonadales bacterium]|nr:Uma2 family endonuclease [Fimbriimonadales bacterium]
MAASTAPAKPRSRKRAAPRASSAPLPAELQEVLESIERLRNLDLPEEDGVPLETDYHRVQIALLDEVVRQHLGDANDYFCGGNMFVYYSLEQAQDVKDYVEGRKREAKYKGPDFFLVKGVDGSKPRGKWVVWEEGGKYPDLIVEITSSSTEKKDKDENLKLYAPVFHTPEYYWYDPYKDELQGYRLAGNRYEPITPDERGRLWSTVLEAYIGVWDGVWQGRERRWVRLYDRKGDVVPTQAEREAQRADTERQLREQAEAELERLRAKLRELGVEP